MTLRAEKISKRVNDRWVLRDLSFEAMDSDVFGVLGLNDSGKSLLLRVLAGLEKPDTGAITVNGEITDLRQDCEYVPGIKVSENSGFFRRSRPESPEERLERVLASIESGKRFVLLDGVFDGLDPANADRIRSQIHDRAAAGTNDFLITGTDRRQIYLTCNRIGILHKGEFIQTGSPEDVYKHPDSAVSASLTGYVNLIKARRITSSKKDTHEFVTIDGEHRLISGNTEGARLSPINQDSLLCVRPEEVSISFGASFPEDNLVKARVTEVTFLGPVTRIKFDANGLSLQALVLRLVGLEVGEECMVGIPPDRIRILNG